VIFTLGARQFRLHCKYRKSRNARDLDVAARRGAWIAKRSPDLLFRSDESSAAPSARLFIHRFAAAIGDFRRTSSSVAVIIARELEQEERPEQPVPP